MARSRPRRRPRRRQRRRASIAPLQRLARHFGFYTLASLLGFAAAYGWLPERERPAQPRRLVSGDRLRVEILGRLALEEDAEDRAARLRVGRRSGPPPC